MLTHGSLFSGYLGLDMAARMVLGELDTRWVSDIKPASVALLSHRHPGLPNFGDLMAAFPAVGPLPRATADIEPVDVLTASWPCFADATTVLTARGAVAIPEVKVGDLVLTHRNRWRRVLHVGSRSAPIQLVRAQGAPPVRTTAEHPFYVRTHRQHTNGTTGQAVEAWSEPQWRSAADLAGWRTAIPADIEPLPEPAWPLTPWLVGRWVADGWVDLSARRLRFAIGDDKAEKFRAELARAGVVAVEDRAPGCVRFTIGRTDAGSWLVENFGRYAAGKTLPGWLLTSGHRAEWLDGYLAGDGFERDGASWAVTVSRPLAVGLAVLGATLGLAPQVKLTSPPATRQIEGRTVTQRPWYRVGLRRQVARRYIRWQDGAAWGAVKSSTSTGEVERVWNLHVEEDNSYTADGLVVHNCQPHSAAGRRLGEVDPRALWPNVARVIGELRPRLFLGENVDRITTSGELRRVVDTFAALGYVGTWRCVTAAAAGAPHLRPRCFVVAVDGERHDAVAGAVGDEAPFRLSADALVPTPTARDGRRGAGWGDLPGRPLSETVHRFAGTFGQPAHLVDWLEYTPAVRRWESVLGRPAPAPLVPAVRAPHGPVLSPAFCEWLMGLPEGWVTDVTGLARDRSGDRVAQVDLLGDGVCPQQGAAAYGPMIDHLLGIGPVGELGVSA